MIIRNITGWTVHIRGMYMWRCLFLHWWWRLTSLSSCQRICFTTWTAIFKTVTTRTKFWLHLTWGWLYQQRFAKFYNTCSLFSPFLFSFKKTLNAAEDQFTLWERSQLMFLNNGNWLRFEFSELILQRWNKLQGSSIPISLKTRIKSTHSSLLGLPNKPASEDFIFFIRSTRHKLRFSPLHLH